LTVSEQAAAPSSAEAIQTLQQVGDRTFLLSSGVWVDTTFDATQMTAAAVKFGSERYFALLAAHPELGRFLALGERVTVIADGKAYAVAPDATEAAAGPLPATTPAAAPASPKTTSEETPAAAGSTSLTLCPGAAALGLMGVILPAYLRRKH
jgi:hypothetical protein